MLPIIPNAHTVAKPARAGDDIDSSHGWCILSSNDPLPVDRSCAMPRQHHSQKPTAAPNHHDRQGGRPMTRTIRAPRGTQLTCKNWLIEAPYRMLQNNLDPDVAFDPDNLIVYGGRGRAARNWASLDAILRALETLEPDETLLVQSGKPVAVF